MNSEDLTLLKREFACEVFDNCLDAIESKLGKTPKESVELAKAETLDMWLGTFGRIPNLKEITFEKYFSTAQSHLGAKKEALINYILSNWK